MRFENAFLRYSRRSPWVLSDVNLVLEPGQVAVVLGRNGAGKTTLLSAAAGLLRPGRGRVTDRPRRVGWVPERFPANQPFRVRSYLTGMARVHGLSRATAATEMVAWARRLHLERYLDVRLAEVSKGTAQKVGLIQALLARPDLLVLDEPWEGLDAATREEVPQIIAETLADGRSVLVSDHLGEVERLPVAVHWHVRDATVHAETTEPPTVHAETTGPAAVHAEAAAAASRWVIEVAASGPEAAGVADRLRAHGYDVLRVRAETADSREAR